MSKNLLERLASLLAFTAEAGHPSISLYSLSNVRKQYINAVNRGASQFQMSEFKSHLSLQIGHGVWEKLFIFSSIFLLICNMGLIIVIIIT